MHSIGADIHEESIRCHAVDPARRKIAAQTLLCGHPAVAGEVSALSVGGGGHRRL